MMMMPVPLKQNWFRLLVEILTLTFIGCLLVTVVRGWKYLQYGFLGLLPEILRLNLNENLLGVFLFLLVYLLSFFGLARVIKNTKWSSYLAAAVSGLPFLLYFGYEINRINEIHPAAFLTQPSIIFNLKVGIALMLLWLFVAAGLSFWLRRRILGSSGVLWPVALLFGIVLAFFISPGLFGKLHANEKSPNILILLIDCLRADHLSGYGYHRPTSPNLDQLAKEGILFSEAISQSTFTGTSIASLFTSLNPHQHGVYWGNRQNPKETVVSTALMENEITLAEVLLKNGFLTAAWIRQAHLRLHSGLSQGFLLYNNDGQNHIRNIHQQFNTWVQKIGKQHKFFAYLHYLDLHDPYKPEPPYDTLYGVHGDVYANVRINKYFGYQIRDFHPGKMKLEKKYVDQLIAYYDGLVTYIDHEIGILIEELKQAGLYDNSLIIVTSDHGDAFMEHGFVSHSWFPYEELIRVPLIVKFPHSKYGGKIVNDQVRLIDIMPTILDFLDIETNERLEGFSLLNYVDETRNREGQIDFPKFAYSATGDPSDKAYPMVAIRTKDFKYLHFKSYPDELYDLRADPGEQNNIIELEPALAEEFRRMAVEVVLEGQEKILEEVPLDKATIDELRALGYIQ